MDAKDWQTMIALLCVLAAVGWWARRIARWVQKDGSCGTGCGRCGPGELQQLDTSAVQQKRPHG